MTDMNDRIRQRLARMESEQDVRLLYACESGSRAWGFPSADSDYDVRFIYVRSRDWYLRLDVERQRDVIEYPIDDLLDINGWDLKKALNLFSRSNPSLIEWLHSPIVYCQDTNFLTALRGLLPLYYSERACFYHYRQMARGNYREYLRGDQVRVKKYFYVLRPLLALRWIAAGRGVVPVDFRELLDATLEDGLLKRDIHSLLERKKEGLESDYAPPIASISRFIARELDNPAVPEFAPPPVGMDALNQLFLKVLKP